MKKISEKKKLAYKIIRKIFLAIFIAFTVLYFTQATGYYEYQLHEKVILNEEKIKQFEQDIKDGKDINVDNYITEEVINYENNVSKLGLTISNNLSSTIKDSMNSVFKYIGKMVEE